MKAFRPKSNRPRGGCRASAPGSATAPALRVLSPPRHRSPMLLRPLVPLLVGCAPGRLLLSGWCVLHTHKPEERAFHLAGLHRAWRQWIRRRREPVGGRRDVTSQEQR